MEFEGSDFGSDFGSENFVPPWVGGEGNKKGRDRGEGFKRFKGLKGLCFSGRQKMNKLITIFLYEITMF